MPLFEAEIRHACLVGLQESPSVAARKLVPGRLVVDADALCIHHGDKTKSIPADKIIGVRALTLRVSGGQQQGPGAAPPTGDGPDLAIFLVAQDTKTKKVTQTTIACQGAGPALTAVRTFLYQQDGEVPERHALVLINPASGRKRGPKIFDSVKTLLALSHVRVTARLTSHQGHATEMMQEKGLSKYDAVVCVSGDGLLNEALDGVMRRPDWEEALKTPLGIIPAGTGNGLAKSLGLEDPTWAARCLVKGVTQGLDLLGVKQEGEADRFGFLEILWAFVADVDIESEKLRWMGAARNTVYALVRLMNLKHYRTRLTYLPYQPGQPSPLEGEGPIKGSAALATADNGWLVLEDDFVLLVCANAPYQAEDALFTPYSTTCDGVIDILYGFKKDNPKTKMIKSMLDSETGKHVYHPGMRYTKAHAFLLEPLEDRGIVDLDGEVLPRKATYCECLPGLLRVIAPTETAESPFPLSELNLEQSHAERPGAPQPKPRGDTKTAFV